MPTVNIELETAVDNLIECRRKLFQEIILEVIKADRKMVFTEVEAVLNDFIKKLPKRKR